MTPLIDSDIEERDAPTLGAVNDNRRHRPAYKIAWRGTQPTVLHGHFIWIAGKNKGGYWRVRASGRQQMPDTWYRSIDEALDAAILGIARNVSFYGDDRLRPKEMSRLLCQLERLRSKLRKRNLIK